MSRRNKELNNDFNEIDKYYLNIIRKNFVMYREINALSQMKLSKILDYEISYIKKLEAPNVPDDIHLVLLSRVAKLYDVPITDFFIEHEEMPLINVDIDKEYINKFKKIKWNDDKYYDLIRMNIYRYRKFKRYSQVELSHKIGFADKYISNIECGKHKFTIITLGRLANLFDIPITDFFIKVPKHIKDEFFQNKK